MNQLFILSFLYELNLGYQTSDEEKSLYKSILSWTQCCLPVIPATWKTEVGDSLSPGV